MEKLNSLIWILVLTTAGTVAFAQQPTAVSKPSSPIEDYRLGPDSETHAEVPKGKVAEFTLTDSKVFPGFQHKWWLYVPAQYDGKTPIALMVFQDGGGLGFVQREGRWRVPIVLDNLIARKDLPVMAAVFVDPGVPKGHPDQPTEERSFEYDTLSGQYASFLIDEIVPLVRKYVRITDDPDGRGIGGCSSGGIAAFTVAWERPDQFRKVLSFSGSFTNIRGGQAYPSLVQEADKKPIRIFQQSGSHDMDVPRWGSWAQANKVLAAALDQKGYDHKFVFGEDVHCGMQGPSILPTAMRWLWRDYLR